MSAAILQSLVYPTNNACDTGALRFASLQLRSNATDCTNAAAKQATCSSDTSAWELYDSTLVQSCVKNNDSPNSSFAALNKAYARIDYFSDTGCKNQTFAFYTVMNECYYVRPDLSGLFTVDSQNKLHWDFYTGGSCTGEALQQFQTFNTTTKCDSSDNTIANFLDPTGSYTYSVQILGPNTPTPKANITANPEYNKVYTKEVYTALNAIVLQDPQDDVLNKWLFAVIGKCDAGVGHPVDPACFCKYSEEWKAARSACKDVDAVYKNNNTDCLAIDAGYAACNVYAATSGVQSAAPTNVGSVYSGAQATGVVGLTMLAIVALLL